MKFRFLPADGEWKCLQCALLERYVRADTVIHSGTPGQRGTKRAGICGNHAECFNESDFLEAQRRYEEREFRE